MTERWRLLRRRPSLFWWFTWFVAVAPSCQAAGTPLFQISWWRQYGAWLPEPTSTCFDGKPFHHPDTPWVVSHPVLRFIFPIPLTVTSTLLGIVIVVSMTLLDDRLGGGRKTGKIRFRPPKTLNAAEEQMRWARSG